MYILFENKVNFVIMVNDLIKIQLYFLNLEVIIKKLF